MTNAEKFKEVFGFTPNNNACLYGDNCHDCPMPEYIKVSNGYRWCAKIFWESKYDGKGGE